MSVYVSNLKCVCVFVCVCVCVCGYVCVCMCVCVWSVQLSKLNFSNLLKFF